MSVQCVPECWSTKEWRCRCQNSEELLVRLAVSESSVILLHPPLYL